MADTSSSFNNSSTSIPLRDLPAASQCRQAFLEPLGIPTSMPKDFGPVARKIEKWDEKTRKTWTGLERASVYGRAMGMGIAVGDSLRLLRAIRTRPIDQWLSGAPSEATREFNDWRSGFLDRCDALGALATEALVTCDLSMPDAGVWAMLSRNPARIAVMLGGSGPIAWLSVVASAKHLAWREREFFKGFMARQLRKAGIPLGVAKAERAIERVNRKGGKTLLTSRHIEPVIDAYDELARSEVSRTEADTMVIAALKYADRGSGKPWKGLTRLYELIVYSGLTPQDPEWSRAFHEAMTGAVVYTHVPGREWIVRDYALGKTLMQLDGKITSGDRLAGLQQGRSSLATGYIRGGHERTEFGRHYSKPLAAFLDSMVVAEGSDHQRQRKAFIPFFSQGEVLAHGQFVEQRVESLIQQAGEVARRNNGHFDLRTDFAYLFPISVICRVLGIPSKDTATVQHWAEASVRAMDTEAGLSFEVSVAGERASDALRHYLSDRLKRARQGEDVGKVMMAVAMDETLSENEKVANLGVLIFAGFETTTGLITKGVDALLRHREQWEYLRSALTEDDKAVAGVPDRDWRWLFWASTQPERTVDVARRDKLRTLCDEPASKERFEAVSRQEEALDTAIEELLRWTAPGTVVPLTASRNVEAVLADAQVIKGCPYSAGARVEFERSETINVAVDELNRRAPVKCGRFAEADASVMDVTRPDNTAHLSFGLRHSCIGAFLAKENAKRALEGLLRHFPDLELAGVAIPQEMELFSGLASLPLRSAMATR